MNEMSDKCFFLAGFLAIMCCVEVVRKLHENQEIKFPICLTFVACTLLLVAGTTLTLLNR